MGNKCAQCGKEYTVDLTNGYVAAHAFGFCCEDCRWRKCHRREFDEFIKNLELRNTTLSLFELRVIEATKEHLWEMWCLNYEDFH